MFDSYLDLLKLHRVGLSNNAHGPKLWIRRQKLFQSEKPKSDAKLCPRDLKWDANFVSAEQLILLRWASIRARKVPVVFPTYCVSHFLQHITYIIFWSKQLIACLMWQISPVAEHLKLLVSKEYVQVVQFPHLLNPVRTRFGRALFSRWMGGNLARQRMSRMFLCLL